MVMKLLFSTGDLVDQANGNLMAIRDILRELWNDPELTVVKLDELPEGVRGVIRLSNVSHDLGLWWPKDGEPELEGPIG
jgi:hypothetical protein